MTARDRTARIIEWNTEKGYGFLQNNGGRLFLHIRDFSKRDRLPAPATSFASASVTIVKAAPAP